MGKHKNKGSEALALKELYKKLKSLEEAVQKLEERSIEYNINIEKLDIQKLENLTFHLDSLDIEELSGSLNLGNNFGVKTNKDCDAIFRTKTKAKNKIKKDNSAVKPEEK